MPLALAICVRVSCVCSLTSVTCVPVSAPPEASETVPVMPPRVCCAREDGARRSMQRIENKIEKTKKDFLLIICNIPPERQRDRGSRNSSTTTEAASLKNQKQGLLRVMLKQPKKRCEKNRSAKRETETHTFAGTNQ